MILVSDAFSLFLSTGCIRHRERQPWRDCETGDGARKGTACSAMMGNLNPGERVGGKQARSRRQGLSAIQVIQPVTLRRKMNWILMMMIPAMWVNHARIIAPSDDAQTWYRRPVKPPQAYKFPRSRTGVHKHSNILRDSSHSRKSRHVHCNQRNRIAIPGGPHYRQKRIAMRNVVSTGSCLWVLG